MEFTISFKVYITWMKFKNAIPHNDHGVFIFNQNKLEHANYKYTRLVILSNT